MGFGYDYRCKKCGHRYSVFLGIGMLYPKVYEDTVKEIREGRYGDEWKTLFEQTPYAAINPAKVLYVCTCGRWETGVDLTLYAPNDPDAVAEKKYGEKTAKEWGYLPYADGWDLQEHFHVLRRWDRRCEACGGRMRRADRQEAKSLPCPKCGEPNASEDVIMWD